MNTIKFYLFGKFGLEIDGKLINKVEPQKAGELLCFLLLNKEQPHPREKLAELLWGKVTENQSNNYLRKALWQLQSTLARVGVKKNQFLWIEDNWLQVNPQFKLWVDVAIFDDAYKLTQGIPGSNLQADQAQQINHAVEVYRGDLLDGYYYDWCLYERERFQYQYLAMLDKLMDYCEIRQQYEEGISYGEKILRYDRARERTHRRLMRLYYLSGNRTASLRQYQKCANILREELDVEPAQRTRDLLEAIRLDKSENVQHPSKPNAGKIDNFRNRPLTIIFNHLTALQNDLNKIQTRLTDDIQNIQKTLGNNS